jgi:hypothetical protein
MKTSPNPRLLLIFAHFTILKLIDFARHVVLSLTGNANFTSLTPTLVELAASADALEAAQLAAVDGDRVAIAARKAAKASTIGLLRQLASCLQMQGQSDRAILATSGFEVSRIPSPIGPVNPPGAPGLTRGKSDGEIKAKVPTAKGAASVNWRLALASDPTVYLQTAATSKFSNKFTGLAAGEMYLIQANFVTTAGVTSWGPTSALMAL